MTYEDFQDLPQRTACPKVFRYKSFNITKNPKYDEYKIGIASMIYKGFEKKSSDGAIKYNVMPNQQLAEELN